MSELIQIIVIDENGFILESDFISIDEKLNSNQIPNKFEDRHSDIIKPKWNGTEWIEGATQEEIDELSKPIVKKPTDYDLLKEQVSLLTIENQELTDTLDMILTELIPNLTGGI